MLFLNLDDKVVLNPEQDESQKQHPGHPGPPDDAEAQDQQQVPNIQGMADESIGAVRNQLRYVHIPGPSVFPGIGHSPEAQGLTEYDQRKTDEEGQAGGLRKDKDDEEKGDGSVATNAK